LSTRSDVLHKATYKSMEEGKVSFYKIRVKGHLDRRWSDWFDGLEIINLQSGETILSGDVVDQAALHGVLAKVRDLNLLLISVTSVSSHQREPVLRPAER
jgi:hypothetical protein